MFRKQRPNPGPVPAATFSHADPVTVPVKADRPVVYPRFIAPPLDGRIVVFEQDHDDTGSQAKAHRHGEQRRRHRDRKRRR